MAGLRRFPNLYEINTCHFLRRMRQKYGKPLTLLTIPDVEWQTIATKGFDLVWLMGVWERSPRSRREALSHLELRHEYDHALPGWTDEDVSGSPYAIYNYELNPLLGQPGDLAWLKVKLNKIGLKLVLDFVANHLAVDHSWVATHPQRFVQADVTGRKEHPEWFFSIGGRRYFAHGRDPNFPPWTDTAQVNFYSPEMRDALINELKRVASVCDGVRCDMAMLALNEVFGRVWGRYAGYTEPGMEFWSEALFQVKQDRPDFLFLAEAYWDMERQLQRLGFDYTYDKGLYDRLRYSGDYEIRNLLSDESYQEHSVHFIENHDEERAAAAFGIERSLAAAAVISTVPGLRLFHDGQLEGYRTRMPVQLVRQNVENTNFEIQRFYERLLTACNSPVFHDGQWQLLDFNRVGDATTSHPDLLAWHWILSSDKNQQVKIVVVNYSDVHAYGWLKLPFPDGPQNITMQEELPDKLLTHNTNPIENQGIYLEFKPWQAQILAIKELI